MNPNDPSILAALGTVYAKKGDYKNAILMLQEGGKLHINNPFLLSSLGHVYGVAGKTSETQEIANGFIEISKKGYFPPMFIFRVYEGMGDV